MRWSAWMVVAAIPAACLAMGCSSSDSGNGTTTDAGTGSDTGTATDTGGGGNGGDYPSDGQRPPTTGRLAIEAWLKAGSYTSWHCETAPHDARSPSPHGINRICSNDVLSAAAAGEYPVDASGVKELYDAAGTTVVGYAVYRHVKAGTTGDTWYWYETVPAESKVPHDANGVVADGVGSAGPAKDICVGCHSAAGSDTAHFGHDFVYTQVK